MNVSSCHAYSIFQSLRKTAIVLKVSHSTNSRWLKNPTKKPYIFWNKYID